MWADLRREVVQMFAELERVDVRSLTKSSGRFSDQHADAERWLAASHEERTALRPGFDDRLTALRSRLARAWKPRTRDRNAYARALRQRPDLREKNRERSKVWRQTRMTDAQREANRLRAKAWREARRKAS